jgi:transglutaminase-like putative cysteine protease
VAGWKVRLSSYIAGLATGGAFSVLFDGGALPYVLGAALVALLVGSAGTYRFILLFPAAGLYTLVAVYGSPPLSLGGWRRLTEEIGQDVYDVAGITYANPVPYDLHPGLLVILIPIIIIVVAFATSATLYEESPVISVAVLGLSIGILSTVSSGAGVGMFFAVFLVSGVALLVLTGDGVKRSEGSVTAVLAGALVVGVVLALPNLPFAEEAIRPALIDWTRIGTGGTSRLAVEADVGDYLTAGRDTELMRIRSPEPLLWRGGTLDYFDGVRWSSTVEPGDDDGEEISMNVPTREVVQRVEILEAETSLLFGGYRIQSVSRPYASERSDSSWSSARPLTKNSSYRVLSQIPQPSVAQLESAGAAYPATVQQKFLQLPDDRPEILSETAQKIQADYEPQTPYEAARAIERYLIYDGGFTYNLGTDYNRADRAIEEFLGDGKEGFCTQFATSMALISRELGIPSRVVYGATTGRKVEADEYLVTGYNIHTWVEIYFPGVGWYPFDPTPGFSVPAAMEANAPRPELPNDLSYVSSEAPALKGEQPSEPVPEQETQTGDGSTFFGETPAWVRYGYIFSPILLFFLVFVPLVKRALAARGRPEDLYRDLTGRLRDVLPFMSGAGATIADSPALTPTERLLLLAGAAGLEPDPFLDFARVYSESLYAPDPRMNAWRAYRKAFREYEKLPRWKRALGAVNPASLFMRARRRLAACKVWLEKTLRTKVKGLRVFRGKR